MLLANCRRACCFHFLLIWGTGEIGTYELTCTASFTDWFDQAPAGAQEKQSGSKV